MQLFLKPEAETDFSRSEVSVQYDADEGVFKAGSASVIGAEENANFAQIHAEQAASTLNSLITEYGFKPHPQALSVILRDSGTITNNPNYFSNNKKGSLTAQQLMYTIIKQGGLQVSEETRDDITANQDAFAEFIINTANKMQDDIARKSYSMPTMIHDQTFYGIDSVRGNNNNYTPFAYRQAAQEFARNAFKIKEETVNGKQIMVETGFEVMGDNTLRYYEQPLGEKRNESVQ